MVTENIQAVLERVYAARTPEPGDIEHLLSLQDEREKTVLFAFADGVRKRFAGDGILARGIIEFSNYCRNTCQYCGLTRYNKQLQRYKLSHDQIMTAVKEIAAAGIRTVVLQSGEDENLDPDWLKDLVEQIKSDFDIAVTLSVGERTFEEYKLWRQAGADRYLLKIETSDAALYRSLHPHMSFENRIACLKNLKAIGYQTGSGNIVGLKGQTIRTLAQDILFFQEEEFDMIGIGPFIPHHCTQLCDEPAGSLDLTLKVIAVTRIVTKNAHLPASTAVGSVGTGDARVLALGAGANVIMPNFTPQPYRKLYEIYPGKRCVDEPVGRCVNCLEMMAKTINRTMDYSTGDSLKETKNRITAELIFERK
jgi:biotin synthase